MTVKLQITNFEAFLEVLRHCKEQVALIDSSDLCCDLRTNVLVQGELRSSFAANGKFLSLTLRVCSREDYFRIVNSCIGNDRSRA